MITTKYIKPIVIISLIAIVYFIFSCKKDTSNTIIINGKVFDPNQNAYIANATVQFLSSKIQSNTYNPGFNVVATAITDANGNFHINYTKDEDVSFEIIVSGAQYYDQTYNISVADMSGGTYTPTYNIYSEAYFKIHLKNTSLSNQIGYTFTNTQPSCYNCCNYNVATIGFGTTFDSTAVCNTFGAQKINVQWSVLKNGVSHQYDSLIYCPPFDTTLFNLYY